MDPELDSPNEYPLDFAEGLSLQGLASTKLALHLWRVKIYNEVIRGNISIWTFRHNCWLEQDHKFSCREVLHAPTPIKNIIDERIVLVGEELRIWVREFSMVITELFMVRNYSDSRPDELLSILFENIVLKSDNTICFENTARMVLTNFPLNAETKYKMACEFCLEDCVRLYWPLAQHEVQAKKQSWLVQRWSTVMKGSFENVLNVTESQLVFFLVEDKYRLVFAYFWKKLTDEEQGSLAVQVLRDPRINHSTMKFLLAKLKRAQAENVCEIVGQYILGRPVLKDEHFECTMNYWMYMKDFISGNIFYRIISKLWRIVANHSESQIETINRTGSLLREMWISAPDPTKAFILNTDHFTPLFELLDDRVRGVENYNTNMAVVFDILANADFELRHTVWSRYWRKFIVRSEPSNLEQLMILCLANEEEIEQFKDRRMANFEELKPYFSSCIEKKFIGELCQYLSYCVKDPRRLENLSKEIILSNLHTILSCNDEDDLAMYHSLIHSTFRNSQSADKFIDELILSPEFLAVIYSKLDDGCFEEVIQMSGRFPTSQRNLNEMKIGLLEYCKNNFARGHITRFVALKFNNFLNWCSSNETAISEFKRSLNIDHIFETIMNKFIREGLSWALAQPTLALFDEFLEWYFGFAEGAKVYKSSKMIRYQENDVMKNVFQKCGLSFVDRFLKWAFDDDTDRIEIVKLALGR